MQGGKTTDTGLLPAVDIAAAEFVTGTAAIIKTVIGVFGRAEMAIILIVLLRNLGPRTLVSHAQPGLSMVLPMPLVLGILLWSAAVAHLCIMG